MARRPTRSQNQPLIFDTDVLIWYFRGDPKARTLLANTAPDNRWITSVNLMELLQGCRDQDELSDVQAFVAENFSRILHPKTALSEKAIHLIAQYSLSQGLRVIDALIAAAALLHRATLVTGNIKHFRFVPGLHYQAFTPATR